MKKSQFVALFDEFVQKETAQTYQQQASTTTARPQHAWFSRNDLGGKALNLVKLLQGGFNVPKGFFVVTSAFVKFLEQQPDLTCNIFLALQKLIVTKNNSDTQVTTNVQQIQQVSQQIRAQFHQHAMPTMIMSEIAAAYEKVVKEQHNASQRIAFAVRSSGVAEDTESFSFAGQHDTFLNVTSLEHVTSKIVECWSSIFTERALLYRAQHGFMNANDYTANAVDVNSKEQVVQHMIRIVPSMCVVVQWMVFSDCSGIMFTADPFVSNRQVITINASYGLGEALVSGIVLADHYKVKKLQKKPFAKILHKNISEKKVAIRPIASTTTTTTTDKQEFTQVENVPQSLQNKSTLTDKQILQLASIGLQIEKYYGTYQDVEWGIQGNELYILQSRSITTLYPLAQPIEAPSLKSAIDAMKKNQDIVLKPDTYRLYMSFSHIQVMTSPMSTMGQSVLFHFLMAMLKDFCPPGFENRVCSIAGRIYMDASDLLKIPNADQGLAQNKQMTDNLMGDVMLYALKSEDFLKRGPTLSNALMFKVLGTYMSFAPGILGALFSLDPTTAVHEFQTKNDAKLDELNKVFFKSMTSTSDYKEVVKQLKPFLARYSKEGFMASSLAQIPGMIGGALVKQMTNEKDLVDSLSKGLVGNVIQDMDFAVGDLADVARTYPNVAKAIAQMVQSSTTNSSLSAETVIQQMQQVTPGGKEFVEQLQHFLNLYGMRGPSELDIARDRYQDHLGILLQVILANLQGSKETGAHKLKQEKLLDDGNHALELLLEKTNKQVAASCCGCMSTKPRLVKRGAHLAKYCNVLREHPKHYWMKAMAVCKSHIKNVAKQFVQASIILKESDIYHLTLNELEEIATNASKFTSSDIQSLIAHRKQQMERYAKLTPPRVQSSDGENLEVSFLQSVAHDAHHGDDTLVGSGVSSGIVEGIARVVLDPTTSSLQVGEILVCEFTDPGWTVLFLNAKALVMEVGGELTHGSVVAREMGIPAVVGVREARKKIQSGMKIRVNGSAGTVEILEQPKEDKLEEEEVQVLLV